MKEANWSTSAKGDPRVGERELLYQVQGRPLGPPLGCRIQMNSGSWRPRFGAVIVEIVIAGLACPVLRSPACLHDATASQEVLCRPFPWGPTGSSQSGCGCCAESPFPGLSVWEAR